MDTCLMTILQLNMSSCLSLYYRGDRCIFSVWQQVLNPIQSNPVSSDGCRYSSMPTSWISNIHTQIGRCPVPVRSALKSF